METLLSDHSQSSWCNYEFCINNLILFKRKGVRNRGREKKYFKFNVFGPGSGESAEVGIGCLKG